MISWFLRLSAMSGCMLTVQRLLGILSFSVVLCFSPTCALSLSLSLSLTEEIKYKRETKAKVYFFLIFFNVYLFLRQGETEHEQGRGRERGRHRIRNRLQALSCQHTARRGARTHGPWDHDLSRSRTLNRPSHPGAPNLCSVICQKETFCTNMNGMPWRTIVYSYYSKYFLIVIIIHSIYYVQRYCSKQCIYDSFNLYHLLMRRRCSYPLH